MDGVYEHLVWTTSGATQLGEIRRCSEQPPSKLLRPTHALFGLLLGQ